MAEKQAPPFVVLESEFVFKYMRSLNPAAIQVYLALCVHADKERSCWPSKRRLGELCSLSVSGIEKALRELLEQDLIMRTPRFAQDGGQRSNAYSIVSFVDPSLVHGKDRSLTPERGRPLTGERGRPLTGESPEQTQEEQDSGRTEEQDSKSSGLVSKADQSERTELPERSSGSNTIASMVSIYHEACPSLPEAIKITPAREKRLLTRLKSDLGNSLDAWRVYCENIEASDYLTGKVKDWRADLDWIINLNNFVKIMEGRYVNRKNRNQGGQASQYESIRRSIEGEDDPSGQAPGS